MTHAETPERLMSLRDACALLSVSRASLYRLVSAGLFPVVRIGGRVLVQTSDLHAFIEAHKTNGSAGNRAVVRASADGDGGHAEP